MHLCHDISHGNEYFNDVKGTAVTLNILSADALLPFFRKDVCCCFVSQGFYVQGWISWVVCTGSLITGCLVILDFF